MKPNIQPIYVLLKAACLVIGSLLLLSACGFALKGSAKPLPFKSVQLQAAANSVLAEDIHTRLQAKGVQLNTLADSATPRLALLDEIRDKTVASTTTTGRVREFKLRQQVTVQLLGDVGQVWLEPVTLVQTRDFSYNDSQVLAKEIEEQALYKDMQLELVLAVMRRLDAAANLPMPKTGSVPAPAPNAKP